jgi:hypothetical protein
MYLLSRAFELHLLNKDIQANFHLAYLFKYSRVIVNSFPLVIHFHFVTCFGGTILYLFRCRKSASWRSHLPPLSAIVQSTMTQTTIENNAAAHNPTHFTSKNPSNTTPTVVFAPKRRLRRACLRVTSIATHDIATQIKAHGS